MAPRTHRPSFAQIYNGILRGEPAAEAALEQILGFELWRFCRDLGLDDAKATARVQEILILLAANAYSDWGGGYGPRLIKPEQFEEWCWQAARQLLVPHWALEDGALHPHFRTLYGVKLDFDVLLGRLPPLERAAVLELETSARRPNFADAGQRLRANPVVLRFAYGGGIRNLSRLISTDPIIRARDSQLARKIATLHGQQAGAVRMRFHELVYLKSAFRDAWPQLTAMERRTLDTLGTGRPFDYDMAGNVLAIRPETVKRFEEKALRSLHEMLRRPPIGGPRIGAMLSHMVRFHHP